MNESQLLVRRLCIAPIRHGKWIKEVRRKYKDRKRRKEGGKNTTKKKNTYIGLRLLIHQQTTTSLIEHAVKHFIKDHL